MPRGIDMILSLGFKRETIFTARNVERITPEIIQCDCPECEGDGDWTKFMPEEDGWDPGSIPCIQCKGTGRIYA